MLRSLFGRLPASRSASRRLRTQSESKPRFRPLCSETASLLLEDRIAPAAFTPGNLVIYRVGNGAETISNNGNSVFLDEYTTTGTLVQSIAMPVTASGGNFQLIAAGTPTSEGMITQSSNEQYLLLTGTRATWAERLHFREQPRQR